MKTITNTNMSYTHYECGSLNKPVKSMSYTDYASMYGAGLTINSSCFNFYKIIGYIPEIKNVIFSNPATIVFWCDGTKTVVKATNEDFDPEKGLAMAIAKKALGNKGNYFNHIKKWLPEEEEK